MKNHDFFKKMKNTLQRNSLFWQMAGLMFVGVTVACALTLVVALRVSEKIYLDTVSKSARQSLQQVTEKMNMQNQSNVTAITELRTHWASRSYLTSKENTSVRSSYTMFYFTQLVKSLGFTDDTLLPTLILASSDGLVYYTGGYSGISASSHTILQAQFTQKAKEEPQKIQYFFTEEPLSGRQDEACIVVSAAMCDGSGRAPYGYAYLVIDQTMLKRFYAALSNASSRLMLLNDAGVIVSAEDATLIGTKQPALLFAAKKMEAGQAPFVSSSLQNVPVSVVSQSVGSWGLHAVSAIDDGAVISMLRKSSQLAIWISVVVALCAALFLFIAIHLRTRPLQKLVEQMRQASEHTTFEELPVSGGYEVRQLTGAYNVLVQKIHEHVAHLIEAEQQKRALELRSLRMQINPHFIYNTLTSIKLLVWQQKTEIVVAALDRFTSLLRNTISNDADIITVAEEIQSLESYIFLQKIRFGENITAELHADEATLQCLIPKLILQPFLENAFFYAFPQEQKGSYIGVFIRIHAEYLICEIIDNGCGMQTEQAKSEHRSTGIGINNVRERLRLLYADKSAVDVSSTLGKGTSVRVKIPLHTQNEPDTTR